jgi:hypothetical protein
MQHLPSHHPFHGGLVSYFLSAVHLGRQHKYSNRSKVKHKHMATSKLSHLRRIPNLLPPRCPRHLLLLLLVLHQMQQTCSHSLFHYVLASFFLSVVCLHHTLTVVNDVGCGQLILPFHPVLLYSALFLPNYCYFNKGDVPIYSTRMKVDQRSAEFTSRRADVMSLFNVDHDKDCGSTKISLKI